METTLARDLYQQFNELYSTNHRVIPSIEKAFYNDYLESLTDKNMKPDLKGLCEFHPSGSSKCPRELYSKFNEFPKDDKEVIPYQQRWVTNSSLVHMRVQKDLMYMAKLQPNARLKLYYTDDNKPAWEHNIKDTKIIEHNNIKLALTGMMDGQLIDTKTGEIIGFEFKTKSNTIAQVGTYKLKSPPEYHLLQCVAYSLLFGINKFIIMYEALAKDMWQKGNDARDDIRTFEYDVTEEDRTALLDKFVDVVKAVETDTEPEKNLDKCMFCKYKTACSLADSM